VPFGTISPARRRAPAEERSWPSPPAGQTNLLDPANLAKIGSALASTLKAAIATAASPASPDPSLGGTLTASHAEG
jgi:hypothetical protein